MIAAALEYARAGRHVFPCAGKAPLTGRGHHDATVDPDKIRALWAANPDANIGLALEPSGLVVLDIDRHGKVDGAEALKAIRSELTPTRNARTGGGGAHLYYLRGDAPAVRRIRWRPGLDLLANGYVIAPGSTGYTWANDRDIAPLPAILAAGLAEVRVVASTPVADRGEYGPASDRVIAAARERLERHGPSIKGAGGDQHTYQVGAILLHGYALAEEEAWPLALEWNDRNTAVPGNPKWSEDKLALKLRNGSRYASGAYGHARMLADLTLFERPAKAAIVEVPSSTYVTTHYQKRADKLVKGRDVDGAVDGKLIKAALSPRVGAVVDVAATAEALVRHRPGGATDDQIAAMLTERGINVDDARAAIEGAAGVDLATVEGKAKSAEGFDTDDKGRIIGNQANLRHAFELLEVDLGFDLFTEQALINGEPVTDAHENALEAALEQRFALVVEFNRFRRYLDVFARERKFHPVREYLDGLEWDGVPRLCAGGGWISTYAGAKIEDPLHAEYVAEIGRLVMQAAVRRVRQPGCKFDEMIVWESPLHGTNKSQAVEILAVREEWFTNNLPLDGDPKLLIEATAGKWIVEAGELAGIRRADPEFLKRMLSTRVDSARLAFRRNPERRARQWVAIGTSNRSDYGADATGNRRIWPVEITKFDLEALRRDRDQLWAEAVALDNAALLEGGEALACARIRLPEHLWVVAGRQQSDRYVADPIEDKLAGILDGKAGTVREADLLELAGFAEPTRDHATRLGTAMRRIPGGWAKTRHRVGAGARVAVWTNDRGVAAPCYTIAQLRPPPAGFGAQLPTGAPLHSVP